MRFTTAVCRTVTGLAVLGAAACVRAAGTSDPSLPPLLARRLSPQFRHDHVAPVRSSHTEIGADVLSLDPDLPVYDVVRRHWPAMLRPAPLSPAWQQDPRGDIYGVYASAGWMGGQETLRTVPSRHVLAVYRLSPTQEFARFGRYHAGGAVEIVWR